LATFELWRLRFQLHAEEPVVFPPGKAANTLRGAFGMMLRESASPAAYARLFAPTGSEGPSGLADRPRPFVLRAAHLDGQTIPAGSSFYFDIHLFDTRNPASEALQNAYSRLATSGLGAGRAHAALVSVGKEHIAIPLDSTPDAAACVRVRFVTPTELKGAVRPEFGILFARLRDRISTLRALYGPGPLEIDFRGMGERAGRVALTDCNLAWHATKRRSSRTGQTHPIGGFTGEAQYEGELTEFLPYLRAGQWTGVGRQTVWGKGEICFQLCS
jgi:hypothetical protein